MDYNKSQTSQFENLAIATYNNNKEIARKEISPKSLEDFNTFLEEVKQYNTEHAEENLYQKIIHF